MPSRPPIDAPMECPNCRELHHPREVFMCILTKRMSSARADAVLNRVSERLGGATHAEAMEMYPDPPEES